MNTQLTTSKEAGLHSASIILATILAALLIFGFSATAEAASAVADSATDEFHLTYDISGSLGSTAGRGYQELSLGLNAHFKEWFVWRNSAFARFIEGSENVYGLDTSGRFVLKLGDTNFGLTAFVGPGYRVAASAGNSRADSAPFAEGGIIAKLAGLSIGGGVKTVFNSVVRPGAAEDTQYFLILAGGSSIY